MDCEKHKVSIVLSTTKILVLGGVILRPTHPAAAACILSPTFTVGTFLFSMTVRSNYLRLDSNLFTPLAVKWKLCFLLSLVEKINAPNDTI